MNDASTITMIANLTSSIDIKLAFDFLSVLHPTNPDGTKFVHPKNTRNKIPYFGVDNAIVCVKYKGKIRGIRQNEGQMNNVVSVDLQTGNKNINLKLAKTNVQLTGATSDNMGKNSFNVLCAHLNMVQGHLNHIRSLPETVKQFTIQWVSEKTIPINGVIPPFNYEYITNESKSNSYIDPRFATFLWQFSDEYTSYLDFSQKLKSVIEICYSKDNIVIENDEVSVINCRISNSVYNYNIGKEVSLIGLTKYLHKKGFSVSFHNWNSTHLMVSIPISDDNHSIAGDSIFVGSDSGSDMSLSSKLKVHRFSIHKTLSIKQTSPSESSLALEARSTLLSEIYKYLEVNVIE
jgi:hypothetical protein